MRLNVFRIHASYLIYLLVALVCVVQSLILDVPGDSNVFYRAGSDLRAGINPWLESEDSVNFQYLNGPINSLFWALSSLLGMKGNFIFTTVLSLISAPLLIVNTLKLFQLDTKERDVILLSVILVSTFAFRSNIQYGQVVVIYATAAVYLLNQLRNGASSSQMKVLSSLGLYSCMDFKPQVFILIFLFIQRNSIKYVFTGFGIGLIAQALIAYSVTGSPFPVDWIMRIVGRGNEEGSHSGYYGFIALLNEIGISTRLSWFICVISASAVTYLLCARDTDIKLALLIVYFFFSPVLHPQDFILLFAFLIVSNKNWSVLLPLGFAISWSTNSFVAIFYLFVSLFSSFYFLKSYNFEISKFYISAFLVPQIAFLLVPFIISDSDTLRIYFNCFAIFLSVIVLTGKLSMDFISLQLRR